MRLLSIFSGDVIIIPDDRGLSEFECFSVIELYTIRTIIINALSLLQTGSSLP